MSGSGTATAPKRVRADGEWWVLVVTDGLTIEFPPELYRDHDAARSEAERWQECSLADPALPSTAPSKTGGKLVMSGSA